MKPYVLSQYMYSASPANSQGSTPRVEDNLRKEQRKYRRKIYNQEVLISPHSTPLAPVSNSTDKAPSSPLGDISPIRKMSQLNQSTLEAVNIAMQELATGEDPPAIFIDQVMDALKVSTNEEVFNPQEKAKQDLPGFLNLAKTGVSHGAPLFAGPNVKKEMRQEKYQLFRNTSRLLETQQIKQEMPPLLLLERMDLFSKSTLLGESRQDPATVVPPAGKDQMVDLQIAASELCEYFQFVGCCNDAVKRDFAIMNLKVVYNVMVAAIAGINGNPDAWLGKNGEPRSFREENTTVRLDEYGNMYLLNPKTLYMQLVPPMTEATNSQGGEPASKKQKTSSSSSSSSGGAYTFPEHTFEWEESLRVEEKKAESKK